MRKNEVKLKYKNHGVCKRVSGGAEHQLTINKLGVGLGDVIGVKFKIKSKNDIEKVKWNTTVHLPNDTTDTYNFETPSNKVRFFNWTFGEEEELIPGKWLIEIELPDYPEAGKISQEFDISIVPDGFLKGFHIHNLVDQTREILKANGADNENFNSHFEQLFIDEFKTDTGRFCFVDLSIAESKILHKLLKQGLNLEKFAAYLNSWLKFFPKVEEKGSGRYIGHMDSTYVANIKDVGEFVANLTKTLRNVNLIEACVNFLEKDLKDYNLSDQYQFLLHAYELENHFSDERSEKMAEKILKSKPDFNEKQLVEIYKAFPEDKFSLVRNSETSVLIPLMDLIAEKYSNEKLPPSIVDEILIPERQYCIDNYNDIDYYYSKKLKKDVFVLTSKLLNVHDKIEDEIKEETEETVRYLDASVSDESLKLFKSVLFTFYPHVEDGATGMLERLPFGLHKEVKAPLERIAEILGEEFEEEKTDKYINIYRKFLNDFHNIVLSCEISLGEYEVIDILKDDYDISYNSSVIKDAVEMTFKKFNIPPEKFNDEDFDFSDYNVTEEKVNQEYSENCEILFFKKMTDLGNSKKKFQLKQWHLDMVEVIRWELWINLSDHCSRLSWGLDLDDFDDSEFWDEGLDFGNLINRLCNDKMSTTYFPVIQHNPKRPFGDNTYWYNELPSLGLEGIKVDRDHRVDDETIDRLDITYGELCHALWCMSNYGTWKKKES